MNNLTHPTYIKARDLILKSEGRALEDEQSSAIRRQTSYCLKCDEDLSDLIGWDSIGEKIECRNCGHFMEVDYDESYINGNEENHWFLVNLKGFDPISLDRVLMALEKWYWKNPMANEPGWDWYILIITKEWKLGQPLHLQSEEVWEKIVEILEDNQK